MGIILDYDLRNNFEAIHLAANKFIHAFGPEFTNTPQGNIETDIIGASTIAGSMILRVSGIDLSKYEAGTVLLADIYEGQNSVLNFVTGVSITLGIDFRLNKIEKLKNKFKLFTPKDVLKQYQPKILPLEMSRILEPKLIEICKEVNLEIKFIPYIAVLTAAKLIAAGLKLNLISLPVARELLLYYVVFGSKTVPYPIL
jgi:hypothetical protein